MAGEPKISDLVLMHLKTMQPDEAKRYLDRIAEDARAVAAEKAAVEQEKRLEFAKLSADERNELLSKAKPGSEDFKLLTEMNREYIAASIPRAEDPAKVAVRDAMQIELADELAKLLAHPTRNIARIREINKTLAELRERDMG